MKKNRNALQDLAAGWEKSLRHDGDFYLWQAYQLGRGSLRRAKCYFCDKVRPCRVLDLAEGDDVKEQSFFVCPRCEKKHASKD